MFRWVPRKAAEDLEEPEGEQPSEDTIIHGLHFPNLAPLTKKLLAIPPTSESEHVFSCAVIL